MDSTTISLRLTRSLSSKAVISIMLEGFVPVKKKGEEYNKKPVLITMATAIPALFDTVSVFADSAILLKL
ncbi:MAG TPA: hypothetical protein VIO11_05845, partial [Candidatus Methanoperedens sp.]